MTKDTTKIQSKKSKAVKTIKQASLSPISLSMPPALNTKEDFLEMVDSISKLDNHPMTWRITSKAVISGTCSASMTLEFGVALDHLLETFRGSRVASMFDTLLSDSSYEDLKGVLGQATIPRMIGPLLKAKIKRNSSTEYAYGDQAKGYIDISLVENQIHFDFANTIEYLVDASILIDNSKFRKSVWLPISSLSLDQASSPTFSILLDDDSLIQIDLELERQ